MASKVDVVLEHIGDQFPDGSINDYGEFDDTQSLENIRKAVRDSAMKILKNELFLSNPLIKIVHTNGSGFHLNDEYLSKRRRSKKDDPDLQVKSLKIYWNVASNTQPTQSRTDLSVRSDDEPSDSHEDLRTESMDEGNICPIKPIVKLLESIKNSCCSDLDSPTKLNWKEVNKDELDQYLSGCPEKGKTDQTGTGNTPSTPEILEWLTNPSIFDPSRWNNFDLQVLSSTAASNSNLALTQNPKAFKRPNSSEDGTTEKKPKHHAVQRSQSTSILPKKMIDIKVLDNKKPVLVEDPYDAAKISVLKEFNRDKMIQFPKGINPTRRERYVTDSEKPPRIQRKKLAGERPNESMLPVLKLPKDYHKLMAGKLVMMGLACVKQCRTLQSDNGEEIEYCLVGYIQFKYYSKENETMLPMRVIHPSGEIDQAEQLIFEIVKPNNEENEYILIAHPLKVKDQFRNEMGPVMFRLSAEYIKTAENNGLKFAERQSEHCYAAYLFKYDIQTNQYVPDFETLALSFYEFPEKEAK